MRYFIFAMSWVALGIMDKELERLSFERHAMAGWLHFFHGADYFRRKVTG